MAHTEIIKLIVGYALAAVLALTAVFSCLSLVGWVRFVDPKQQNKLFGLFILELVGSGVAYFQGLLRFGPEAVEAHVRQEAIDPIASTDLAQRVGILEISARANDFLPRLGALLDGAQSEITIVGVSFYITVPERKAELIAALRRGVRVRFLVLDPESANMAEIARGFSQTVEELRAECEVTLKGLAAIRSVIAREACAERFQIRLFDAVPRARFYVIDPESAQGRMYMVPHVNQRNSPTLPGFLLAFGERSLGAIYLPAVEEQWDSASGKPF
jgi:hypothetical protein